MDATSSARTLCTEKRNDNAFKYLYKSQINSSRGKIALEIEQTHPSFQDPLETPFGNSAQNECWKLLSQENERM